MATRAKPSAHTMRRHGSLAPRGTGVVLPVFHAAARAGRTIFASRVFAPEEVGRVLKSGHQSRKIGAFVTKGFARGWPVYTLTLEERATCPRSCTEWLSCYGNNMQAAERIEPGRDLEQALVAELGALQRAHPAGFMVRLHVLGDFYSVEYVNHWGALLAALPACHVFGFTAHPLSSDIGRAISLVSEQQGWPRFAIRFSGAPHRVRASRVLAAGERDADGTLCPAQTGATDCCGTCALCWHGDGTILFRRH